MHVQENTDLNRIEKLNIPGDDHGGDIYSHPGLLDFSANINPLGPPKEVLHAATESLQHLDVYPDCRHRKLCNALAEKEKVDVKQIIPGNGAAELIYACIMAMKPKKALIITPGFSEYEKALALVGCDIVEFPLFHPAAFSDQEGGLFSSDFSKSGKSNLTENINPLFAENNPSFLSERIAPGLLEYIGPELDMMILVNPNNPTGNLFHKKLCKKIIEKCRQNRVLLMVDECFMDFVDEERQVHMLDTMSSQSMVNKEQRKSPEGQLTNQIEKKLSEETRITGLIVLKAFTKIYAIPGVRLGYAVTSTAKLADRIRPYLQPWNVSVIADACGLAALQAEKNTDFLRETRDYVKRERCLLIGALESAGFAVYPPAANYIFFKGPQGLQEKMLEKGILIRSCANYRGLDQGFYRIAVRRKDENHIFRKALQELT